MPNKSNLDRELQRFILTAYRAIEWFRRRKISYIVVWALGFLLVYAYESRQPGRTAAIVSSNQQFDLPVNILWADENEVGIVAGDSAGAAPRVYVMPLPFRTRASSLLRPAAYVAEPADAKPLITPGIGAPAIAAAWDNECGVLADAYVSGDHYAICVWERDNDKWRTTLDTDIQRWIVVDGIRVPVSITDLAWMSVPAQVPPGVQPDRYLVAFYCAHPLQTPERGGALVHAGQASPGRGAIVAGVACIGCTYAVAGIDPVAAAQKQHGPHAAKAEAEPSQLSGPALSEVGTWNLGNRETPGKFGTPGTPGTLLPAFPDARWVGVGQEDPMDRPRRIETVVLGAWTDVIRKQRPYVFEIVANPGGKPAVRANLSPVDVSVGRNESIENGSASWSADGASVLYDAAPFNPAWPSAAAQMMDDQTPEKTEWEQVRPGHYRGFWSYDLYQTAASGGGRAAGSRVMSVYADSSRFPLGLTLTGSCPPAADSSLSCFLFVSGMNNDHYNIWIARDDPPSPNAGGVNPIELTYQRRITRPARAFHAGDYLYVAAVEDEIVENGASPSRFRVTVFRWPEAELYADVASSDDDDVTQLAKMWDRFRHGGPSKNSEACASAPGDN
jgi:hypothetical protein